MELTSFPQADHASTHAYMDADTDQNLTVWWENVTTHGGGRFDAAISEIFGYNNYRCGISSDESCQAPSCFGRSSLAVRLHMVP